MKIMKISLCRSCPMLRYTLIGTNICSATPHPHKEVNAFEDIPDWCPLEDAPCAVWHKVADNDFPPEGEVVQVYAPLCICVAYYEDGKWYAPENDWDEDDWEEWEQHTPTHWTNLQRVPIDK